MMKTRKRTNYVYNKNTLGGSRLRMVTIYNNKYPELNVTRQVTKKQEKLLRREIKRKKRSLKKREKAEAALKKKGKKTLKRNKFINFFIRQKSKKNQKLKSRSKSKSKSRSRSKNKNKEPHQTYQLPLRLINPDKKLSPMGIKMERIARQTMSDSL